MTKLNKAVLHLPVAMLFSYILLCFFRSPELADALVVSALSTLYGFFMYMIFKTPKDIVVPKEVKELQDAIAILRLEREKVALEDDKGRLLANKDARYEESKKFKF